MAVRKSVVHVGMTFLELSLFRYLILHKESNGVVYTLELEEELDRRLSEYNHRAIRVLMVVPLEYCFS